MKIAKIVKKLKLTNNYVLLIDKEDDLAQHINEIGAELEKMDIRGLVMVVDKLDNVRILPEIEMNKNGWYRIETLRNTILRSAPIKSEKETDDNDSEPAEQEV